MTPDWIILAVGVAGAVVMLARSRLRRGRVADVEPVSRQWLAEERRGRGHDPRR